MFCDHDETDFMRKKEDRFTIIAAPLFIIFFVIPFSWKLLKLLWHLTIWCCTYTVYVEEDETEEP